MILPLFLSVDNESVCFTIIEPASANMIVTEHMLVVSSFLANPMVCTLQETDYQRFWIGRCELNICP